MDFADFAKDKLWAITPEAFDTILRQVHEFKFDAQEASTIAAIQASIPARGGYALQDGIAVIDVAGPLSKRLGFMSFFFGGTSYEGIGSAFKAALADNAVKGIALRIDSPGGTLGGLDEVASLIFNARGVKPVVAFAEGSMTSAAYWIGSAADRVFAQRMAVLGSIGVLIVHADWSEWNKRVGVNVTYLTAGKYKALANPDEPLSELARKEIQEKLDYYYGIFTGAVSEHRGVSDKDVRSRMAEGKIFVGEQAREAGLVDEIGSFQDALEYLRSKTVDGRVAAKTTFELIPNTEGNEAMDLKSLTIEMLSNERPDLIQEIAQKEQAAVSTRVSALEATVKAQSETIAAQQEKILESEKRETLRAEKEIKLTADGIWKEKLSASKIPVRLHDKVKLHVDHEKFVKDQVLDEAAFAKAVADEVSFFEKEIQPASGDKVLGSSFPNKTEAGNSEDAEDDAYVDRMLALAGQAPEKK